MEDPAARILKDRLIIDPDFDFLAAIQHPLLRDQAQQLGWWHRSFRFELKLVEDVFAQPEIPRLTRVPRSDIELPDHRTMLRCKAACEADEFVESCADLLLFGHLDTDYPTVSEAEH